METGAIYLGFAGSFSTGYPVSAQSVSMTVGSVILNIAPRIIPLVGVLSANSGLVNTGGFYFFTPPVGTTDSFAVEVTSVANTSFVDVSNASVFATFCYAPSIPSPLCPVLPSGGGIGYWTFSGQSGLWFDPPATSSYEYTGTGGTTFTRINLVTGFGAVNVQYGPGFASSLGSFAGGSMVDFVALTGGPLSAFRISGINPSVDAADPNAYPLQVFFSSANGTFTQNAVPEPATYSLFIAGAILAGLLKAKVRLWG